MFGLSNLKLIAIGIGLLGLGGIPAWAAWKLGAQSTLEEADNRVQAARQDMEQFMMKERQLTDYWKDLADQKYAELLHGVSNIEIKHTTITKNITVERASNPEFYEQQVPKGGVKEWHDSRQLLQP